MLRTGSKQSSRFFLTLLPHKFKFLIPVVSFAFPPPSVISQVTPESERMNHPGDTFLE
jgi:hypothetical protein